MESHPIPFSFVASIQETGVTRSGLAIRPGKKKSLLVFDADQALSLEAYALNRLSINTLKAIFLYLIHPSRFVGIRIGRDYLLLSIRSIAKRFYTTEEEVLKEKAKGQKAFQTFLEERAFALSQALFHYRRLFNERIPKKARKFRGLRPSLLFKAVRATASIQGNAELEVKDHSGSGVHFFVEQVGKEKRFYQFCDWLGRGHFSDVYCVETLDHLTTKAQGERYVYKMALSEEGAEALENEMALLKEINPEGRLEGIQPPPYTCYPVTSLALLKEDCYGEEKKSVGLLMELYHSDYKYGLLNWRKPEERSILLSDFSQLLFGLNTLHQNNIRHGDIKPSNIFVKMDGNKRLVYLADFGGACRLNREFTQEVTERVITTSVYGCDRDFLLRDILTHITSQAVLNRFNEYAKKIDVFALGVTFYQALLGAWEKFPYYLIMQSRDKMMLESAGGLHLDGIPELFHPLLKGMLDHDMERRWDAKRCLEELECLKRGALEERPRTP